jgi:hypothetical protein
MQNLHFSDKNGKVQQKQYTFVELIDILGKRSEFCSINHKRMVDWVKANFPQQYREFLCKQLTQKIAN